MKKLILSLATLATITAPAAAGRLDVDPSVLQPPPRSATYLGLGIDPSTTRSTQATSTMEEDTRPASDSKQRGAQGAYFGANGR